MLLLFVRTRFRNFTFLFLFFLFFAFNSIFLRAQETVVLGKVIDANSGDAIPFVNVVFKGTSIGTTTDFDGNFLLKTTAPADSLQASYIGYKPKSRYVKKGIRQTILHFTWDDGTQMDCLFEGSQLDRRTGLTYPKQISSHPNKDTLGIYLRRRLGVVGNRRITLQYQHCWLFQ